MPELPEVETMKKILLPAKNLKIKKSYISDKKLRVAINENFQELVIHQKITDIKRKAKYLILDLENDISIIGHAGMSGNFFLEKNKKEIKKHDHIILYLEGDISITYNDPRRFGLIYALPSNELSSSKFFQNIALDATSEKFNASYLLNNLKNMNSSIKIALLNQKVVAGIGNIYACEALYQAKISPLRKANSLNKKEIEILIKEIKRVLFNAIEAGGSTLKDYRPEGKSGYFQHYFSVYGKEGEKCPNCTCNQGIERITQSNRSTFYCSKLQK